MKLSPKVTPLLFLFPSPLFQHSTQRCAITLLLSSHFFVPEAKMWLPFLLLVFGDALKADLPNGTLRKLILFPSPLTLTLTFFLSLLLSFIPVSINDAQLMVRETQLAHINRHNKKKKKEREGHKESKASEIAFLQRSKGSHKSTSRASG